MRQAAWCRIPALLVGLRLALGPLLLVLAFWHPSRVGWIVVLVTGGISDAFDGVIARHFGCVTSQSARADSMADGVFFACVVLTIWIVHPEIIAAYRGPLLGVAAFQAFSWGNDLVRYGRIASFHAYLAKISGTLLFLTSVSILGFGHAEPFLFWALVAVVAGNLEGMMVYLLPEWTHDVPSAWHAWQLHRTRRRTGKE